ncbi:hypothetical protein A2477_00020 [Candidatus Falkowbacteria bacterium RIFOXYC2_FULL_47_12]|uniref:Endolytic murein transglycosylase n=2 Tax=Candidatus Falkowiibacteriota TaxID=1752728 RepID=A0A1F5TR76_9BACT|nr:MAG: hypothetical protein A2242_02930 [Candidatus Falkowbacteria bacterium RIFOXYA2_FULL_47_9]OGF41435.1 MAG: hypothetical protein A2477_00020 [Candidatus Falkowbacteria bacterium RIFOXYC2_FULL_47_12]
MPQKITAIIGIIISIVVLVGATLYISYWRGVSRYIQTQSAEVLFTVEPNSGVSDISAKLKTEGIIASPFYFDIYVAFQKIDRKLQAGEYMLNKNMNVRQIAKALSQGEAQSRERAIKIIEGWDIKDIAAYLVKEGVIKKENDFTVLTKHEIDTCFSLEACQASFLAQIPANADLEGYLFPDTYRIFKDASAEDIIAKMLTTMDEKITDDMKAEMTRQGKTLHEILTVASIIEREVRTPEDMKTVAGIFYNRLTAGIALQSDATLSYALNDKKPAHTSAELSLDSPYNTYKYRGLPPGPIASSGMAAIQAALYPAQTDYLYFLSDLETGTTYFAKTLAEHNKNKRLYLK